jgi:tetratricopeptide (TPR) repeat protein
VQLVDAKSGRELMTLEAPEPKNVSALSFSPDGRLLIIALDIARIQVWDLGLIRHRVESLGLHWPVDTRAAPVPSSLANPKQILIDDAPWMAPLALGEQLARLGRWDDAASAFEQAVAAGARHIEAQFCRVLVASARGDKAAYGGACRQFLRGFEASDLEPSVANMLAWACALGPGALADYSEVVRLAEQAVASSPVSGRLNTLGAILYRAGRFESSVRQLMRAVEAGGGDGTPHDALFLAMAHHQLGHAEEARHWLRLGTAAEPIASSKPRASGDTSWIPRLELHILRREACAMIEPPRP